MLTLTLLTIGQVEFKMPERRVYCTAISIINSVLFIKLAAVFLMKMKCSDLASSPQVKLLKLIRAVKMKP